MPRSDSANLSLQADPIEQFERMTEVAGRAQQMMMEFWVGEGAKMSARAANPEGFAGIATLWEDMARAWGAADHQKLMQLTGDYWSDALKLWGAMLSGQADDVPEAARREDKRFSGAHWGANPVFDMVRRSYLLASHYLLEGTSIFHDLPEAERRKIRFQARQMVDAMSPSNFAALNPEVLAEAEATNGESLLHGLRNMLDDLKRGRMTMTDEAAFEVGRNVAATPGRVVFENRLFQLIHYAPTTVEVAETPLLIFPPWINKFYILDLTPQKSFIRWAVEQGQSVFVVSWRQAGPETADVTLDHYVEEGFLAAIDAVRAICGVPSVNVIGYCVAGTTLAIVLAYLAARGEAAKIRSATYFTAQVDFADAGELLNFADEQTIRTLESNSVEKGVVDGRWLATSFNLLRPTDLMWNYVVENYLKGKEYVPFDLLYWNSDPTNVPGLWHLDYIRDLYRDNKLTVAGGIRVKDVPIDLKQVMTPSFIQAGNDDHIAPPKSCFKLTAAFGGPHHFLLAGSGHIAGVVNPPAANKYSYWALPEGVAEPDTLEAFRSTAALHPGSWWPHWMKWLETYAGKKVKARIPGKAKGFPAIEDAPGRYVKERIA